MKKILFVLIPLFLAGCGKEGINSVRVTRERVGPAYSGDQVKVLFNGTPTSNHIESFIRTEVTRDIQKSEDEKSITGNIQTKDINSPWIKYFKNKSKLLYNNKFYPQNEIPDVNPATIKDLVYIDSVDTPLSYLKVITHP